ncbi:DNA polymerase III subunit beta [Streptomyces sp. SID9727]|uniref:DNA polymerase III subunit beta n=1 Tax=Streptomyces sp. SID9727 TaxID=2706114 RepID=UPI0013CC2129|nr:DNA polymerase III subunit beta [Streptomyces sp. SID9727]NEC67220.1 DNA polymerase III subunit beta [Streptomyces sp. SID9727]
MEFRIERGELADAVAWAARVLPTRSPVPVLGGLLLEATDDRLSISGLDYEASARIEVAARTERPGKVLVMGRRLLDVCKVLPDGPVECAVEGSRFTVTGGGAGFGLSVLPLDDYPALPPLPEILGEVDGQEFAAAVADVSVAAGRDDTLPTLTGIRLALDGERMTLAATDRYRFAVRTLDWRPTGHGTTADVVVSARRLSEIARSVGARPGTVRLALDSGSAGFEREGMRTTVRLLDGRLPRHDKLFVLSGPVKAVTEREPLVEAVKRVAVVADGDSPLQFVFSGDSVLLQAGYEDDVASQRLPAGLLGADEIAVGFNPSYLMDALATFDSPVLRFQLMGQGQRAMITGHRDHEEAVAAADGVGDTVHQHLLMSLRPLIQ